MGTEAGELNSRFLSNLLANLVTWNSYECGGIKFREFVEERTDGWTVGQSVGGRAGDEISCPRL